MILVCPDCQFENPDTNKYCQRCGTSLEQRDCPECGTPVDWHAKDCPNCGAFIGKTGIAIVSSTSTSAPDSVPLTQIDPEHRYQLLTDTVSPTAETQQLSVWDQQPLQKTFLEHLVSAQSALGESPDIDVDATQETTNVGFWQRLGVSDVAIPYLVLQESLAPAIPVLQDTWTYQEQTFVLIEDRAAWDSLLTIWSDDAIPFSQLLYWLNETLRLWTELQQFGVIQSLLELDNLCLDEDQTLCLRKLHSPPALATSEPPDLMLLARLWQQLFNQSGRTLYGPIAALLHDFNTGSYETVEALHQALQAIAASESEASESAPQNTAAAPTEPDPNLLPQQPTDPDKMVYQGVADDLPTVVLPMQLLSVMDSGFTEIGEQRNHNEDHFGIETTVRRQENAMGYLVQVDGLYIVCDGMGGHAAGEVASAMAVETIQQYLQTHWSDRTQMPDQDTICEAILTANQKIYDVNLQNARSGSGRMGTTLVMLLVQNANIAIAHVGDSRAYRVTRKHGIEQLTLDHEVGQREILRGVEPEDAYARPDAYQLTQALGPRSNDSVKPDVRYLELKEDTLFFLCSDGVSDGDFLEEHYEDCLTPLISSRANLSQGLVELIDAANAFNGHDNLTGIVIRVKMRPTAEPMAI